MGGTGRTGRHVVQQGLARGHDVTVLARDPERVGDGARAVRGDVTDPDALERVVRGADAVVVALGPAPGSPPPVQTEGLRLLLGVLDGAGAAPLVVVSGAGADAPGDRKRLVDRVASALVHRLNRADVEAKEAQLALLAASGRAWTAVRPPVLVDGPAAGAQLTMRSPGPSRVPRADLAALLLDEAAAPRFSGRAPFAAPLRRRLS
ncbi:NAD(P)-dependent oxidoreductase [Quadrisphaera sp. DSM 44207]|uniref:NAD(P)-dependent oxidoreductase n=1 Tax=Quadrisphaera sp. DSM 44207 TaxID=1881057 RepID=UPI0015A099A8|nr:NAD(P)H-binding protein [Quadrisphaera sp. DSM 44207]